MPVEPRLELKKPDFSVRAQNFFNLMSLPEFQEEFLSNPGRVAARELGVKGLSSSSISSTNRMIFKLLKDPKFNTWAKDFQVRIEKEFPALSKVESISDAASFVRAKDNQKRLVEEFSKSAVAHLDRGVYESLLTKGVLNPGGIRAEGDVAVVPLTFIAIVVVLLVAAGVGKPEDMISRVTLKTTINQLSKKQIEAVGNKSRQI